MHVEQAFVECHSIEAPTHLLDPFASLTTAEIVYLGMDAPRTLSSHARRKSASTTISDSDEEGDDGDDCDGNDDYEEEEEDE
jgi:hypothetical protein